jgi:hypothetical protein
MKAMSPAPQDQRDDQRITCARCGATFGCEPMGDCWCKHEDVRLPMPTAGEGCLCPDCLRAAAASA